LEFIKQGFAVDTPCSPEGLTALHAAAHNGHLGLVEALVGKGAEVDAITTLGSTPLKLAASKGHVEVATALLGAHACVDAASTQGFTPLHAAVGSGCVPMMELLLDSGADVDAGNSKGHTPLHQASQVGQPEAVAVLLDRGATVDLPCEDGHTALHYACGKGNQEVVQQLVQAGAAVNAVSSCGDTPLQYASKEGCVEVVQQLVAAGAAVNAVNEKGATALHVALAAGHVGVAELLLGSGADPSIRDADGSLPLHWATERGLAGLITHLLQQAPALLNSTDSKGFTPLLLASHKGSAEVVQQLLAAGADPGVVTLSGATALHLAATFGHHLIMQQLLAALAAGQGSISVDAEWRGMTPLHCAVESRHSTCVKVLLGAGADPERLLGAAAVPPGRPSLEGATPLHRAVEVGHVAAVPLLATPANMCRLWQGKTPLHLAVSSVDERDLLRHLLRMLMGRTDIGDSMYNTITALLEAGSPAGLPDADGNTALALAASKGDTMITKLVPAMVHNECRRYKQLLAAGEGGQQQQQQSAATVRAGIVDGLHALLVAAAAANLAAPPAAPSAEAADPVGADPADHPASQAGGQGDSPGGAAAAAAADPLAPPKHVLACLEVVLDELGQAAAARMFQGLLLRMCGCGEAGEGGPFHLLVYGLLHSGGWPEVEEQVMRRWGAASRLGQSTAHGEQAADFRQVYDGSSAAEDEMVGLRAQALAAAAASKQQSLVQLLDQLAGLQMAENLQDEVDQVQEGGQAVEVEEGMWELLESLHRTWAAAQQQVLGMMQQEVADSVLGTVMAWEQAGGRARG
jgi:ankyrin repeat protein